MVTKKRYLTRADLVEILGLQGKSQATIYRALRRLADNGAPKIKIADGRWDSERVAATMNNKKGVG